MKIARLLACLLLASCAATGPAVIPKDMPPPSTIVFAPDPDVPASIAAYSGIWGGHWGGDLPTYFVIRRVEKDGSAAVTYSWGANPDPQRKISPGVQYYSGMIKDGVLTIESGNTKFILWLNDGVIARTRFAYGRASGTIKLARVQ